MRVEPFLTADGSLVCTLTSNGYKLMTLNLVRHLQRCKVPWKLCVLCADAGSYRFLSGEGVPCLKLSTLLPDTLMISPFGTKDFQTLNRKKLECLSEFASNPEIRQCVYIDGDIAVYRDFLPDIVERLQDVTLYLQCDENIRAPCTQPDACPNACSGCIAWKHGIPPSIFSLAGPTAQQVWKDLPEDQVFINRMIHRQGVAYRSLPRDLYPNGSFASLYTEKSPNKATAYLLHYNYLVGASKQQKMRANGDWLLPY